MSRHETINPEILGAPRGYSNGILAKPGRLLFVAGQVAWGSDQKIVSDDFAAQFGQALANVASVVTEAGGDVTDICRLTIYVTDKDRYIASVKDVGAKYREVMGKHFPAMALVQVADLLEEGAMVEIEADAVLEVKG